MDWEERPLISQDPLPPPSSQTGRGQYAGPAATGEQERCMICKWGGKLPIEPLSGEESTFIGRIIMIRKLVEDKKLPCTYMSASLVHHLAVMNKAFWAAVSVINDTANLRVCYQKKDSDCKKLLRR